MTNKDSEYNVSASYRHSCYPALSGRAAHMYTHAHAHAHAHGKVVGIKKASQHQCRCRIALVASLSHEKLLSGHFQMSSRQWAAI
jgi:hypothetical protein